MRDGTAAEIVDLALRPKPELVIHAGNLPATAEALRDLLAASGKLFDRGLPVRVIRSADGGPPSAISLTKHNVVIETHRLCQPVKMGSDGGHVPVTLPDRVAQMYLDMSGEWDLPPLAGVSTAPLLSVDGNVRAADGYDSVTSLWCCSIPSAEAAVTRHLVPMPKRHFRCCARHSTRFPLAMRRGAGMPRLKSRSSTSLNRQDGTRALSSSPSSPPFVAPAYGLRRECS